MFTEATLGLNGLSQDQLPGLNLQGTAEQQAFYQALTSQAESLQQGSLADTQSDTSLQIGSSQPPFNLPH